MTVPLRLIVADDSDVYRAALCAFLNALPDIEVVGQARDGEEALRLVQTTAPNLLLLDLEMPKLDGFGVLRRLRQTHPHLPVLVHTSHGDDYLARRALQEGAAGFVPKGEIRRLAETIHALGTDGYDDPAATGPAPLGPAPAL